MIASDLIARFVTENPFKFVNLAHFKLSGSGNCVSYVFRPREDTFHFAITIISSFVFVEDDFAEFNLTNTV